MPTNAEECGEAVSGEISLITGLDTGRVVVDGVERTDANVGEEFRLDSICGREIRLIVTVRWAGDCKEREAVFLVLGHVWKSGGSTHF